MSGTGIGTPVTGGTNDLVTLVNGELENHAASGSWQAVGDGTTKSFTVAPLARYIVNDGTWAVKVNGEATTAFTMDFDTGVITFTTAHALAVPLTANFNYVYWTDELVEQAVNAAINNLFPFFYNPATEVLDSTVEHTFAAPGAEVVTMVVTTGSTVTKMKRNKYTTYKSGDSLVLRWYGAAPSGTIRAHIICRPAMVGGVLNVTDRATAPIVSYAIYHLLSQKQAGRMRSDVAVSTVGQGNLSPRQINDASNSFFLRYQAQCQQSKQLPWSMS